MMKENKSTLVKQWKTKSGLDATIILTFGRHHCGYVKIPEDSFFHGKKYGDKAPSSLQNYLEGKTIGKRGILDIVCNSTSDCIEIGILFDVHGGITYSGNDIMYHGDNGVEKKIEGWLFGFDCNHHGDKPIDNRDTDFSSFLYRDGIFRNESYCIGECESLAKQLVDIQKLIDEAKK